MKRIVFTFIICSILSLCIFAQSAPKPFSEKLFDGKSYCEYAAITAPPIITGHSCYVYNVETGAVIFRKNQDDPVYPASTVKLMTAIVAYENIDDLQTVITASSTAINATKGSNMSIKAGEQLTAEQLLNGLLITGANDAANILAEYVAGDINSFCQMMNTRAKELGCTSTTFSNPTGLHTPEMMTTAKDIAIIANHFLGINTLFEMSNTTRYTVEATPFTSQQRILLNRNLLISRVRSEDYYYSAALGMSLGSTPEAGDCIVTSASDDSGMTYICVVMNSYSADDTNHACLDATALLKMSLEKFKWAGVLTEKTVICEIPVKLAVDTDYVTLIPDSTLSALLPADFSYENDISIEPRISYDFATAPIKSGDAYGEAVIKYKDDIVLGSVSLVASRSIEKSNVLHLLNQAEKIFGGRWFRIFAVTAVILLVLYFIASAVYTSRRRKYRRRRH